MDRLTIGDLLGLCDALGISLGTCDDGTLHIDGSDIEPQQRAWLEANDVTLASALEYGARLARIAASQARHRPHSGTPARTLCATLMRVLEMPARDPPVQQRRRLDRDRLNDS